MSDAVRQHVKSLKTPQLWDYLRLAVRNGYDGRAAIADQELTRRRRRQ